MDTLEMKQNERPSMSSLESGESELKRPYGTLHYFSRENPEEGFKIPFHGEAIIGRDKKTCDIVIWDKTLAREHLKVSLGQYCDLKVENIAKSEKMDGIILNKKVIKQGDNQLLRQDDELKIYKWGLKWTPNQWYKNEVEQAEKKSIPKTPQDEFNVHEQCEVIESPSIKDEVRTSSNCDMNQTMDLISFSNFNTPMPKKNTLEELKALTKSMHRTGKSKRSKKKIDIAKRLSMMSVASEKSTYMEPTQNSIRRQKPKVRELIMTPSSIKYSDMSRTQQIRRLRKENNIETPKQEQTRNVKDRLAELNDAKKMLEQALEPMIEEESKALTPEKIEEKKEMLTTPVKEVIVKTPEKLDLEEKFSSLSLTENKRRYNLRSTVKKPKEAYNLRSSCKKHEMKRMQTPLKNAIHKCQFDNVAYDLKKKLATPMKKSIKERAASKKSRRIKKKLQTPLRKDIKSTALALQKKRVEQDEQLLKAESKVKLASEDKEKIKRMQTPLKNAIHKNQFDNVAYGQKNRLATPMKKSIKERAASKKLRRVKKKLQTPLRKDIKAKAVALQRKRIELENKLLGAELKEEIINAGSLQCQQRAERSQRRLDSPLKKEIVKIAIEKGEQRFEILSKQLKTPMKKEIISSAVEKQNRRENMLKNTMKTPLRKEVIEKALEVQERKQNMLKKKLQTPIRKEVVRTALSIQERRQNALSKTLKTPIRKELRDFDRNTLKAVEYMINELAVDDSRTKLFEELKVAVEIKTEPLTDEQGVTCPLKSTTIEENKENLLNVMQRLFSEVLGEEAEDKVSLYFERFTSEEDGVTNLKEWMSCIVQGAQLPEEEKLSPEKQYYSAYENEEDLGRLDFGMPIRDWEGKHKKLDSPEVLRKPEKYRVCLADFTDCESSQNDEDTDSEESESDSEAEGEVSENEVSMKNATPLPNEEEINSDVEMIDELTPQPVKKVSRRNTRVSKPVPKVLRKRVSTRVAKKLAVEEEEEIAVEKEESDKENAPVTRKYNTRRKTVKSKANQLPSSVTKKVKPTMPIRRSRRLAKGK